jgi:ectoine hydroxylase-related dioxygenase (phytanoyl-CoA dioxygenase family)
MDTHVDADAVARDVAEMRAQGFVIIERLLTTDDLARMRAELKPHLERELFGRNNFEGHRTERVYSLVAVAPIFADLVEHPRILAICDAFLEPNYLLTASQAIEIHPGETPQPLHTDDTFYSIPRPRNAVSVSTIYAIDDFTLENGSTQIIPGSHTWPDDAVERLLGAADFTTAPRDARTPRMPDALPEGYSERLVDATMPAGSVIVFLGTLVHRGGANRSQRPRRALSNQYCEPWARQQENYTLSIARETARTLSPRVQELIGYSIHPPFMGHALGVHPRRYLERD